MCSSHISLFHFAHQTCLGEVVADLNAITHGNSVRENGETYSAFSGRMKVYYEAEKEKALAAEKKCNKASEDFETKVGKRKIEKNKRNMPETFRHMCSRLNCDVKFVIYHTCVLCRR